MLEIIRIQSENRKKEIIEEAKQKGHAFIALKVITHPREMNNPENSFEIAFKPFDSEDLKDYFIGKGYEVVALS